MIGPTCTLEMRLLMSRVGAGENRRDESRNRVEDESLRAVLIAVWGKRMSRIGEWYHLGSKGLKIQCLYGLLEFRGSSSSSNSPRCKTFLTFLWRWNDVDGHRAWRHRCSRSGCNGWIWIEFRFESAWFDGQQRIYWVEGSRYTYYDGCILNLMLVTSKAKE